MLDQSITGFDPKWPLQLRIQRVTIANVTKLLERESELATVRAFARRGEILVVEGRAGVGKTAILDAACSQARREGRLVLRARGSDLESGFAFGIVCQLFERHCNEAPRDERAALFRGVAGSAKALVMRDGSDAAKEGTSFGVVHGLYWLAVNIAECRPVLLAVDDAHQGDDASLRWLAYLATRLDGINASLIVALRPGAPAVASPGPPGVACCGRRDGAPGSAERASNCEHRPQNAGRPQPRTCALTFIASRAATHFYVLELFRALKHSDHPGARAIEDAISNRGLDGIAMQLGARLRSLDPNALRLAQAIAILGDGCELRHAAVISSMKMAHAISLATELVRLDVLARISG